MGLDMYLNRFPRRRGKVNGKEISLSPNNFRAVESWRDYQDYLTKEDSGENSGNSGEKKCSFKEWCGNIAEFLPDKETVNEMLEDLPISYFEWDTEHKHPYRSFSDEVGYWRKANAIHKWFVDTVQNGEDDCGYHREITKSDIEELRDICIEIIQNSDDVSVAEELLPTQSGFFFGNTDYDEYYYDDIKQTIEICDNVLNSTDFNSQQLFYRSSW